MEIWLTVPDFTNYEVSCYGRVRNKITGHILSPGICRGYPQVTLYDGARHWNTTIHRLVADTFYDGDHQGLEVNHIDGDKKNNCIWNLEWCTREENIKHAWENGLYKPSPNFPTKRVRIVETDETFDSLTECAKSIDGSKSGISRCLKGKRKTHRGYHFEYVNDGEGVEQCNA